jgi:alpha-glucosidase
MHGYRDFDNDQDRYSYEEGAVFLEKLHKSGIHYIPIVDSALYIPNPNNASDAYVYHSAQSRRARRTDK